MIWEREMQDVAKLAASYLLALPVGWHREKEAHSVGVRTFPVVCMASCAWIVLGGASVDTQSRVMQGIVAGIGFVGGGAILKSESHVHGTATAASIWNIAAVGAAVGLEHYMVAVMLALLNLIALRLLAPVKRQLDSDPEEPPTSPAKPGRDD